MSQSHRDCFLRYLNPIPAANKLHSLFVVGLLIVAGATGIFAATTVPSVPFSESFEGTHIYPFWSLTQESGTVTLSKEQAYSGTEPALPSLGIRLSSPLWFRPPN